MIRATAIVTSAGKSGTFDAQDEILEEALTTLAWKVENCYGGDKYTGRITVTRHGQPSDGLSAKARDVLQIQRRTLFWNGTVEII